MIPVNVLFSYAGPPIIGAFIGYLTNKIAIRMLFRPLKAWHVAGVRVPMTPGVIPSKRHDLAENIGEMVGRHLLTSSDIGAALSEEPFQEHLQSIVNNRVSEVLQQDLGSVYTIIPRRFLAYAKIGVRTLKYQLRESLHRYVESEDFEKTLTSTVVAQLETIGQKELNAFFDRGQRENVYLVLDGLFRDFLTSPKSETWLADYLSSSIRESDRQNKIVGDYVPETLVTFAKDIIEAQAPNILRKLAGMLSEPAIRERIVHAIKEGVDHFIDSLGPVGAMARGFLDMNSLEAKVHEYLETREEDLVAWLQTPVLQERLAEALVEQVEKFLGKPVTDVLAHLDDEQRTVISREIAVQVFGILRSDHVTQMLSAGLRQSFEEMFKDGNRPLGDIVQQMLPRSTDEAMRASVAGEAITLLRSENTLALLNRILNSMIDTLIGKPVGKIYNLMPAGVRQGMTDYIVLTANRMLLKEVPGLVDSLNIRQMVTEKVDSLDLLRLERLLLSIMEEQFKYINLFGALIGFLIGCVNLLILNLS